MGKLGCGAVLGVMAAMAMARPAAADLYAHGNSYYDQQEFLSLQFSDQSEALVGTNGQQGWWSSNTTNYTGNNNYIVGSFESFAANDFFVFDLSGLSGTVTSATLSVTAFDNTGVATWSLFDVTTPISTLLNLDNNPNGAIYTDLGSGVFYGSTSVAPNDTTDVVSLNGNAVAAINTALGGKFAIGGTLNPVPEPASAAVLAAGLLGLGAIGRRRRRG